MLILLFSRTVINMAPVFSSEIFVQVYLSLQRTVSMIRTAENEQQRMYEQCEINLISLATCIFNVVDFASLQGAFCNFVTQVLPTSSLRIKWS